MGRCRSRAVSAEPFRVQTEPGAAPADERERLLSVLLRKGANARATEDERYDAAVSLHELGTAEALDRLDDRPGHEEARAILRDARWDAPGAGPVPLISAHGRVRAIADVVRLRVRHAARLASARWLKATLGGTVAGVGRGCDRCDRALVLGRSRGWTLGLVVALSVIGARRRRAWRGRHRRRAGDCGNARAVGARGGA